MTNEEARTVQMHGATSTRIASAFFVLSIPIAMLVFEGCGLKRADGKAVGEKFCECQRKQVDIESPDAAGKAIAAATLCQTQLLAETSELDEKEAKVALETFDACGKELLRSLKSPAKQAPASSVRAPSPGNAMPAPAPAPNPSPNP